MSSAFFDGGCECGGTTGGKLGGGLLADVYATVGNRSNGAIAKAVAAAALIVTIIICAAYTWSQKDVGAAARDTMMGFIFSLLVINMGVDLVAGSA